MGLARSGLWAPGYTIENYNIIHLKRLHFEGEPLVKLGNGLLS